MKSHMNLDAAEVIALLKATLLPSSMYYQTRFDVHPYTYGLVISLNCQYVNDQSQPDLKTAHRNVAFLFAKDTAVFAASVSNRRAGFDDLMHRQMLGEHTTEWATLVSNYLNCLHLELAAEIGCTVPAKAHQNSVLFVGNTITEVEVLIKSNEVVEIRTRSPKLTK